MSNTVLVIGNSGTGKSTAIRTLPPEETFIINVLDKPLPFRGTNHKYKRVSKDTPEGNYYATDKSNLILRAITAVDSRTDIKFLVIDDFGYVITHEFMSKALVKGFDKFAEMAVSAWTILDAIRKLRRDLTCFIMMHTDTKEDGIAKPKTIGKMLDEKVCIEGMFTHVLHSVVLDGEYHFITNHDGHHMAKMPMGMFSTPMIPNDLKLVADTMSQYYDEDIKQ